MDADFSHNPRYIPAMIALSAAKDVVIGSRYVPGGGAKNCSWKRIWLSKGANLFARAALGLQAHDATAGFRLYHRYVLESIPLDTIFSSGYSFLVEMLFMCQRRGWQIGEVPIIFEDRAQGPDQNLSPGSFPRPIYGSQAFRKASLLTGTTPVQPKHLSWLK